MIFWLDCGESSGCLVPACDALDEPSGAGLDFIDELKVELLKAGLPAPAPIEQRWTASSTSPMSPAAVEPAKGNILWVVGLCYASG